MTLPAEYNSISMGQVRTELNKASGPISLNDPDVRILFQVQTGDQTTISLHNGHGKSNIMPPSNVVVSSITQTTATVTWKAYQSTAIDGQVDNYQVIVYKLSNNSIAYDSGLLAQSASSNNITGLTASAIHADIANYRVEVSAKNVSATKTTSVNLLTLENVPLKPVTLTVAVQSSTKIIIYTTSTYATTFYIYRDGAVTPTATVGSLPYVDTVGVYTAHTYTVKGHSTGGDGPMSDTSASVRTLPDAPISAVFTTPVSTASSLTINWTLSTSPVVLYYQLVIVNFGTTTEVYRNDNVPNTTTSITIPSLSATSKFTATLYTVNESSIFYNLPVSTSEDIWTLTVAPTTAPVVTKVTDTTLGQTELTITWSENVTGHTSYSLVRYDVTTPGNASVTIPNATSPYTDTGLVSYNEYKYTLLSVNAGGASLPSPVSNTVRTLPGPAKVVTSLAVTLANITNTTAKATWTIPSDIGQVSKFTVNLKQGATTLESKDVLSTDTSSTMESPPWTTTMTANTSYAVSVTTTNDNNSITTTDVAFRTKFAAPSAPAVTSPATSQTALIITWGAITGAAGYKLERTNETTSAVTELTGFTPSGTTTLSYTDSDCTSYNVYHYKLSVLNDGGYSVYSAVSNSVRTLPGPAVAATGVTISSITPSTAVLSWTAATGQVTSYDIIVGGGTAVNVGNVTSTTLGQSPFTALSANTLYSVVIKTINENADTTNASTSAKTFTTITTKPSAPSVTQPATSTTQLDVTWTTNSATTYDLTRYNVTTGATGVLLTNKTTPFTDTSLAAYNEYQYTVTSNNSASPAVGVTSDKSPTGVRTLPNSPVAVSSISVVVKAGSQGASSMTVTVSWVNDNWATQYGVVTKYDIIMTPNGSATDYGATAISGSLTTKDLLSIPSGTLFNVTVKTYNSVGNASSTVQFTSPPAQPGTPYLDTGVTPNPTQTKISLKWTAVGGVLSSYTLKPYKTSDSTALTPVTNIGSNTIDYTATAGMSYNFVVVAVNVGGSSIDSSSVTLASLANVPTNVSASTVANSTNLTVTWDSMTGASSYKVYRTEVVSGIDQTEQLLGTKSQGFTDELTGEKTYYYKVSSVTTNGGESAKSTKSSNVTTLPVKPNAPASITISGYGDTSFTATWDAVTGTITKYTITVYNTAATPAVVFGPVDTTSSTVTKLVDTGLSANTSYTVYVTASNTGGTSTAASKSALTLPAKPTIGTTTVNTSALVVNWTNISGLTYKIFRNGTADANIIKSDGSGGSYSDSSVSAETQYQYYVKATNTSGSGVISDASTAVYSYPAAPAAPSITFTPGSGTAVTVSISSSNATSYKYSYSTTAPTSAATDSNGSSTIANGTLAYGTTYYFVATATRTANSLSSTSALSSAASFTTPPAKPAAPTLTPGTGQIKLTWTANQTYWYEVYRQDVAAGSSSLLTPSKVQFGSNEGIWTDSSAFAFSKEYSYRIKAYDANDKSAISDASTAFTTPADMGAISFTVNWAGFKTINMTMSCLNAAKWYVGVVNVIQNLPSTLPFTTYANLTFNITTDVNGAALDPSYRWSIYPRAASYVTGLTSDPNIPWAIREVASSQVVMKPASYTFTSDQFYSIPYDAAKVSITATGGGGGGGGYEITAGNGGDGGSPKGITGTFTIPNTVTQLSVVLGNGGAAGTSAIGGGTNAAGGTGSVSGGNGGKAGTTGKSGCGGGGGGASRVSGLNTVNVSIITFVEAGGGGGGGGGSANSAGGNGGSLNSLSTSIVGVAGNAGANKSGNGGGGGGGGGNSGAGGLAGTDNGAAAGGGGSGWNYYTTATTATGVANSDPTGNGGAGGKYTTSTAAAAGGKGSVTVSWS